MHTRSSRNYWKSLINLPGYGASTSRCHGRTGMDCGSWLEGYPQLAAVPGLAAQHQANLCFLDIATQHDPALALISETAPFMPVVALNPKNDADLILRCLRRLRISVGMERRPIGGLTGPPGAVASAGAAGEARHGLLRGAR